MRVRISYVVTVEDDVRRHMGLHYGHEGLASRAEVKSWFEAFGRSMDDDISSPFEGCRCRDCIDARRRLRR